MLVFVYGTLKRGYGNHRLLLDSKFIGTAVTVDRMAVTGTYFPYAHPFVDGEKLPLTGEVYEVDNQTLDKLDWLEGVPTHYVRSKATVWQPSSGDWLEVYMYIPSVKTAERLEWNVDPRWIIDFKGTEAVEWRNTP